MKLKSINKMNKKGSMLLRDVMFSVVIFSAILAFASIFVIDMAGTYSNQNMSNEYAVFNNNVTALQGSTQNNTDGLFAEANKPDAGVWGTLAAVFIGIGTFLGLFFSTPLYIGAFVAGSLQTLGVPSDLYGTIKFTISAVIFILIAFGVGTAISRGSKM